jgi:hypothetical protein
MTNTNRTFGRGIKLAIATLAFAALAACTQSFRSDVTRFQSQLPAPQGQTFAVVADDPALAGGLEFSRYADLVEAQMVQLGYTEASPDRATLLVRFDYGVDNGRERVRSTGFRDPFYRGWYGYQPVFYRSRSGQARVAYVPSRAWGFGFYDPWFDNDVDSYTVYTSGVELKIDRAADNTRLFEGRAEALSRSNKLQYLVPNLVEAMFTDFPGNSGETTRISIKPENQPVKRTTRN